MAFAHRCLAFCFITLLGCGENTPSITEGLPLDAASTDERSQPGTDTETATGQPTLTWISRFEMAPGTHRPEILTTKENDIVLVVVQPQTIDGLEVRHQAYRLSNGFDERIPSFPVTTESTTYGTPADHRATLVGDQLFVVYQSLLLNETPPRGQPSEPYAAHQSLLLARFSVDDGTELARETLISQVTDRTTDNFPDHCILWQEERLLVSSGAGSSLRIREFDPFLPAPSNLLATHTIENAYDSIGSVIGNALVNGPNDALWMWGSRGPTDFDLTVSALQDFVPGTPTIFHNEEREHTFPVGVLHHRGLFFVTYIGRDRNGPPGLLENPYSPRILVVNEQLETQLDQAVSTQKGASHVHPTVAAIGDRVYVAWSHQYDEIKPQVVVDIFDLGFEEQP